MQRELFSSFSSHIWKLRSLPTYLTQLNIPYLFIGRHQGRCDPDYQDCRPLPPAFYWMSPASSEGCVLVAYVSYLALVSGDSSTVAQIGNNLPSFIPKRMERHVYPRVDARGVRSIFPQKCSWRLLQFEDQAASLTVSLTSPGLQTKTGYLDWLHRESD